MTIQSLDGLDQQLTERLTAEGLPAAFVSGAVEFIRDQLEPDRASGSLQAIFRFPFQDHGYALKDDDVRLLGDSLEIAFAAANLGVAVGAVGLAIATVLSPATILAIAQVGFNVYRYADKVNRKLVELAPAQFHVLAALKTVNGPASVDQLRKVLAKRKDLDVEKTLAELDGLRKGDGSAAEVVRKETDGRWLAAGI